MDKPRGRNKSKKKRPAGQQDVNSKLKSGRDIKQHKYNELSEIQQVKSTHAPIVIEICGVLHNFDLTAITNFVYTPGNTTLIYYISGKKYRATGQLALRVLSALGTYCKGVTK